MMSLNEQFIKTSDSRGADGKTGLAITFDPPIHKVENGIRKTIELLRKIEREGKYKQSFGRWFGVDKSEACAIAAIAQETDNYEETKNVGGVGKRWYLHNEGIMKDLGISPSIFVRLVELNDDNVLSYGRIADRLEKELESGELLR